MKGFFKHVFASCLGSGLFLVAIGIVLLVIGMIGNIFGGGNDDKSVAEGSVLFLEFDRSITDRDSKNDFNFSGIGFGSEKKEGLNNMLKQIERAKGDENVEGIYMEIVSMPAGGTTAEEIRDKLVEFKESGKWIYTYSESMSQGAYHMATVSDSIFLYPKVA